MSAAGVTTWYLSDLLGSVRELVQTDGTVLDQIAYDSYGNILTETHPSQGDRLKYAGRDWDGEIGLYYYRARYVNPATGTFESEDPTGFGAGDTNLDRYVGNNPTIATDPSGLKIRLVGGNSGSPGHQEIVIDDPDTGEKVAFYYRGTGYGIHRKMTPLWCVIISAGCPIPTVFNIDGSPITIYEGTYDREAYDGGGTVETTIQTSPDQDREFIKRLDKAVGIKAGYASTGPNCRTEAQRDLELAKIMFPEATVTDGPGKEEGGFSGTGGDF